MWSGRETWLGIADGEVGGRGFDGVCMSVWKEKGVGGGGKMWSVIASLGENFR